MRKTNLCLIGIAALLCASCSKKEMITGLKPVLPPVDKTTDTKQITWTQGDSIINGAYNIFSMAGNKALQIAGNAKPTVDNFNNHDSQKWNITNAGDGYFKIENAASGQVLTANKTANAELQEAKYTGVNEQLWNIQHQKQGLYKITNKASNLALTLANSAGSSSVKVIQSAYTGSDKQLMGVTLQDFAAATDSVTIDFSSLSDTIKHVAAGFLHGFSGSNAPSDDLLLPLKINTVRDWIFDDDLRGPRLNKLGYTQQLVVSDGFAQPYNSNGPPGNNGNWTSWENCVAGTVTQGLKTTTSDKLQYDLWNEPNNSGFWNFTGTYAFPGWFFETWKHGYDKARSIDPKAVMVGPSYSSYDVTNLKAFLLYCKTNNCLPNYLSWHFPTDPVSQVAEMNQFMADNDIHVDGIIINEYTLSTQQTAGKNAYLIAQLERAKVTSAMHAIWGSTESGQLDGIVTPMSDGNQKKATWWVYKVYGDMTGRIVQTTRSADIELLATLNDDQKTLRVLLGCRAKTGEGYIKVKFLNVTPEIAHNNTSVHFKLQRIPDALNVGAVQTYIPTEFDKDVAITYGSNMTLLLRWDSEYDAFTFTASEPTQK